MFGWGPGWYGITGTVGGLVDVLPDNASYCVNSTFSNSRVLIPLIIAHPHALPSADSIESAC